MMPDMLPIALLSLCLALSACAFVPIARTSQVVPTPTTVRVLQTTPVPTVQRHLQAVPTAVMVEAEAPAATGVPGCEVPEPLPDVSHRVNATLAYREQTVDVQQAILYTNNSGHVLAQLVFDVEPNRRPGAFTLESIGLSDDQPAPGYELTGRKLAVELPEPLGPGCAIELVFRYALRIPLIVPDDYTGYFGFGSRQINLAHWLIMGAIHQDGEWLVHDDATVGEQTVSGPAAWDVTLTVEGASERLDVVGPGTVEQLGADTWHFVHPNGRDFALSMSEDFRKLEGLSENGVMVELYTFEDAVVDTPGGPVDGAEHALDVAVRSVAMFSDLFGQYPHPRLVIVQGDFPDGMEFSDLVFVGSSWFRSYAGDPASYLTIITVHEVAHQWWYSRVGSDQALTPWMDESLATYSEYIFFEEYYPDLKDWWWRFRVNQWIPEDFDDRSVASSVYEFTSTRDYINAVYLRGARMLRDLREDLGTDAFFNWLRRYAEAGAGQVVSPDLLWSLMSEQEREATQATRDLYLASREVVASP